MRTMSCPLFSVPKKLPTFVDPHFQRSTEQQDNNACVANAPVTWVTSISALFLSATVVNFRQYEIERAAKNKK